MPHWIAYWRRPDVRVAVVGLAWTGVVMILIFMGLADGELACDDAYYYYEIARNAALGQGFTFDSIAPTNGFHPLWAWILVPVYWIFPHSAWAPIHVALCLSAIFIYATALVVYRFFASRSRASTVAGELAAYTWLLNPCTFILGLRGLEGPLNALLLALSILYFQGIRARGTYSLREGALMGASVGFCLLGRTDNVLWLAAVALLALKDLLGRRRFGAALTRGAIFSAAAALVTSPWILWNLSTFGTVMQTSHASKYLFDLYGRLPPLVPEGGAGAGVILDVLLGAVYNLLLVGQSVAKYMVGDEMLPASRGGSILLYAVLGYLLFLALLPRVQANRGEGGPARQTTKAPGPLSAVGLFCLLHFGWYALISRNYYTWYLLPPVLAFSLFHGARLGLLCAGRAQGGWPGDAGAHHQGGGPGAAAGPDHRLCGRARDQGGAGQRRRVAVPAAGGEDHLRPARREHPGVVERGHDRVFCQLPPSP